MTSLTRCIMASIWLLLTIITTQSQVTQAVIYELVLGVRHGHAAGRNIGKCGSFNTREMIEAACTSNPRCAGYSTRQFKSTNPKAVAVNGFYPWCLKSADVGRSVDKTHNFYVKHTQRPTPSPTVLLSTAPTRSCNEKQIWTKKIALENCPAKKHRSKNFGVKACKSSYQERLGLSLANQLYRACRSRCVYDYDAIIAGRMGAFGYMRRKECYRYVTDGNCFEKKKKQYLAATKRAKALCK